MSVLNVMKKRVRGVDYNGRPTNKVARRDYQRRLRFVQALEGTGGIKRKIADNLGVRPATLSRWLSRPEWSDMLELLETERERVNDLAEEVLFDLMEQRIDLGEAAKVARWWLERRANGFNSKKTVEVGGNGVPIRLQNHTIVQVEDLNLPLSVRREMLKAIEAQTP